MAYPQGVNFRGTLGYVTDGPNDNFESCNNAGSPTYPHTTAQGNTIGVETTPMANVDRNNTVDVRLAGIVYTPAVGVTFRMDLPASGSYNVRIAAGDMTSSNRTEWDLYDGTGLLANLTTGQEPAGSFKDANNASHTAANWPGSNTPRNFTFASTICRLKSAPTSGNSVLAHFYVEDAGGGGLTGTLASTLANATIAASGITLNAGAFALTLANATMSASGSVGAAPSGALSSTLGNATMAAAGAVKDVGSFVSTLSGASMAASGILIDQGAFATTTGNATMAASGTVAPNATGTFSSTLDGATMTAYGYNGVPPVLAGFFQRLPKTPRHVQRIP